MLVSVIIPVFNGLPFLKEAIDSVMAQTYKKFELIVINDGSTDGTQALLDKFQKKLGKKMIVIKQKNQGQVIAKNRGIKKAKGELIAFLDSDDLWKREKLESQVNVFKEYKSLGLCYTEAVLIDGKSTVIGYRSANSSYTGKCFERLIEKNQITASSVMIKRECLKRIGIFDETLRTCENWDMWLRISLFFEIQYISQPLTYYRIHENHMSSNISKMMEGKIKVLKKYSFLLSNKKFKKILLNSYFDFAKDSLWNFNPKGAREILKAAFKIDPFSYRFFWLYLKSFLPKSFTSKEKSW